MNEVQKTPFPLGISAEALNGIGMLAAEKFACTWGSREDLNDPEAFGEAIAKAYNSAIVTLFNAKVSKPQASQAGQGA